MTQRYSEEQLEFLRINYKKLRVPELTVIFNQAFTSDKTTNQIKATLKNHKIRCGRGPGLCKGEKLSLTSNQVGFIKTQYKHLSMRDLVLAFNEKYNTNKSYNQLRAFTRNHKIVGGRTGHFEKGAIPWNAGTKGFTCANVTSFRKGQVPPNLKPIGHERICNKDGYVLIKIDEINPHTGFRGQYKLKHRVIWEAEHGPVTTGMVIRFIDGDKTNCKISNLELVSRALNARLNKHKYSKIPEELKPTVRIIAELEEAMNRWKE